ncbi:PaaI family thioesterase [Rhodococcoides kyotonense]|nr:PaaI family thioesterase [Rhodococcus kyotonensis]
MSNALAGKALADRAALALSIPVAQNLGVRLIDDDAPWLGATFEILHDASNGAGSAHASMLAAGMELAGYLALLPQLGEHEHAVTHSFSLDLSTAVAVGTRVRTSGTVDRRTRRLAFVAVTLSSNGAVAARAQLVKSIVPYQT